MTKGWGSDIISPQIRLLIGKNGLHMEKSVLKCSFCDQYPIARIGKENDLSAEIYVCWNCSYKPECNWGYRQFLNEKREEKLAN